MFDVVTDKKEISVIDLFSSINELEENLYRLSQEQRIQLHFVYNTATGLFGCEPQLTDVIYGEDGGLADHDLNISFVYLDEEQIYSLFNLFKETIKDISEKELDLGIDLQSFYKATFTTFVEMVKSNPQALSFGMDVLFSVGAIVFNRWLSPIQEKSGSISVIEEQVTFYHYDPEEKTEYDQEIGSGVSLGSILQDKLGI